MFKFKARHHGNSQSILVRRDMSPGEFTDALSYAMGLFDVQIVGFKDATGLIVTPS